MKKRKNQKHDGRMYAIRGHMKQCGHLCGLALLLVGLMLTGSGCGVWSWMWAEPGEETADPQTLTVGTLQDTEEETEPLFELNNSVEYTGEAHAGTEICYTGHGENRAKVIAIDAGHQKAGNNEHEPVGPGAIDTQAKVSWGTVGSFTKIPEYELNLQVALYLRDELIQRGYSVVMIRETNEVDISNAERAAIANKYRADAFVRIHANGMNDASRAGALMVCHTARNPYPDCAAVYPESRLLSDCILEDYCKVTNMDRLYVWETDTKAGTNWSQVPTTILEMGFMTNESDDQRMATDAFRKEAARGIANGLDSYFRHMEDTEASSE